MQVSNDLPHMLTSNQRGRGQEPVTVEGSIISAVTVNMRTTSKVGGEGWRAGEIVRRWAAQGNLWAHPVLGFGLGMKGGPRHVGWAKIAKRAMAHHCDRWAVARFAILAYPTHLPGSVHSMILEATSDRLFPRTRT